MTDITQRTGSTGSEGEHGARAAVQDAGERARDLASTGKEEASRVVGEVKSQTSQLVDETRGRARDRMDSQLQSMASMLGELSSDLDRMAENARPDSSLARLAHDGSTAARSVSRRLETDGLDGVMREMRRFARRRPGMFLLGAFGVGLLAGRVTRNADLSSMTGDGSTGQGMQQTRQPAGPSTWQAGQATWADDDVLAAEMASGLGTEAAWRGPAGSELR